MIFNRLKKNYKRIKSYLKQNNITCFRLYDRDIPEFPYIIDIYEQNAVVYERGKTLKPEDSTQLQKHQQHKEEIEAALLEMNLNLKEIIFKTRAVQKGQEQYKKQSRKNQLTFANEWGYKVLLNLYDYLDTGLFLDHRPLRKLILDSAKDKSVLNLFSYTGCISLAAAFGGARKVTSIDMSKTYLEWSKDNFKINNLDIKGHEFIQADIMGTLDDIKLKYDLIILDPPSFSNSKKMEDILDIQRDHLKLLNSLAKNLSPNGILYFSNNLRKFSLDEQVHEIYHVTDITQKSIPLDFRDMKIHSCFKLTLK